MFIGYEPETRTMGVIFKSGGLSEYHYAGVPQEVFDTVLNSPSVGKAVDQHIKKGGFRYTRVH